MKRLRRNPLSKQRDREIKRGRGEANAVSGGCGTGEAQILGAKTKTNECADIAEDNKQKRPQEDISKLQSGAQVKGGRQQAHREKWGERGRGGGRGGAVQGSQL